MSKNPNAQNPHGNHFQIDSQKVIPLWVFAIENNGDED